MKEKEVTEKEAKHILSWLILQVVCNDICVLFDNIFGYY